MNTDELYTCILTIFEGKSFENQILNKKNTDNKEIFENNYRDKIIEAMNTDEYSNVINKLARSFMTNIAKGTKASNFTKEECNAILEIYHRLIENISDRNKGYEEIAKEHFIAVRNYITYFTEERVNSENRKTGYSPKFVLDILAVNDNEMNGKVLDIGCGKDATVVKYLREKGIDAYGLDMECEDSGCTEQEDWLIKEYPADTYSLILSNLSFSKHFNDANHEENNDEECFEYAKAYMSILNSLKVGGTWHYVPSVTFIEEMLPEDKFEVINTFINENVMRTVVKRIK